MYDYAAPHGSRRVAAVESLSVDAMAALRVEIAGQAEVNTEYVECGVSDGVPQYINDYGVKLARRRVGARCYWSRKHLRRSAGSLRALIS